MISTARKQREAVQDRVSVRSAVTCKKKTCSVEQAVSFRYLRPLSANPKSASAPKLISGAGTSLYCKMPYSLAACIEAALSSSVNTNSDKATPLLFPEPSRRS